MNDQNPEDLERISEGKSGRPMKEFSRNDAEANAAATGITGTLVAGPLAYGFIGWLLDRWLDTDRWFLLGGLLLGMGLALYSIFVRYGTVRETDSEQPTNSGQAPDTKGPETGTTQL